MKLAYFSLEVMLESDIPTYAGGLGVLAGDTLRSCADKGIPAIGISLVYSGHTFNQMVTPDGSQIFVTVDWQRLDQLTKLPQKVHITLAGTEITVNCWRYDIVGLSGHVVPVYLLDTNTPDNLEWARNLTLTLYAGSPETRLGQEALLAEAGVKMLRELEHTDITTYHLNEGHTSLVPLALAKEFKLDLDTIKQRCVFTTHTPVPEGHDKFPYTLVDKYIPDLLPKNIKDLATKDQFHTTHLALNTSHTHIAVSQKHKSVCEQMFPNHQFISITNAVHHRSWTWYIMQNLFDTYLPGWIENPSLLSQASEKIPDDLLWSAHQNSKQDLIHSVNEHLNIQTAVNNLPPLSTEDLFDIDTLTIALARRPVPYKRPLLLYSDIVRLEKIGAKKIQIIQCGKSHPNDEISQTFVREIIRISQKLRGQIRVAYIENYSPKLARLLVSGSDVWLNTPRRPLEASGTSGMKAALNGVINFSILDGWWIEGYHQNPLAGFTIGPETETVDDMEDAADLYTKLESEILPLFYQNRPDWLKRMKAAITLGSYFNTHRFVADHLEKAWK